MQLSIVTIALIVNFGFSWVWSHNLMSDMTVTSNAQTSRDDDSRVQENFQNLVKSIEKNETRNIEHYSKILEGVRTKEEQSYSEMKDKMRAAKTIKFYRKTNTGDTVVKRSVERRHHYNGEDRFKTILAKARSIVVVTGVGISVESGIPLTMRGAGARFNGREVRLIKTGTAFKRNPYSVWQYIESQVELIKVKKPNKAHYALVEFEERCLKEKKNFTLITQTTDGFHKIAGTKNLVEFYGSMRRTKCTVCGNYGENNWDPMFPPPLPGSNFTKYNQQKIKLPRCGVAGCDGQLRPNIVFFGEDVEKKADVASDVAFKYCDLLLLIGNSETFYPMTEMIEHLVWKKIPIAEFSFESTYQTPSFQFHFNGPCSETTKILLD